MDINFNLAEFENLKDYPALNDYIESRYISGANNFVLINEIQLCPNFEWIGKEKAINYHKDCLSVCWIKIYLQYGKLRKDDY